MRFSSVLLVSLAALGLASPAPVQAAETFVLSTNPGGRRFDSIGSGSFGPTANGRHGYRPHPNAYRKRARRRPYSGNLGPRH